MAAEADMRAEYEEKVFGTVGVVDYDRSSGGLFEYRRHRHG